MLFGYLHEKNIQKILKEIKNQGGIISSFKKDKNNYLKKALGFGISKK
mgnify:CR=1 FL=1